MSGKRRLFLEEVKKGWLKKDVEYIKMFGKDNLKELIKWGKDWNYIDGLWFTSYDQGGVDLHSYETSITLAGEEFLENLEISQEKATQIEALSSSLDKLVEVHKEQSEVLKEISFHLANQAAISEEQLRKFREEGDGSCFSKEIREFVAGLISSALTASIIK